MTSVAKSPLFDAPVVGWFLRVMRAVPVAHVTTACTPDERKAMNDVMFATTVARLRDERVKVCIFPEGTCHTSPDIKELKTGTARMALQVAASTGGAVRPPIVPVIMDALDTSNFDAAQSGDRVQAYHGSQGWCSEF